MAATSSPKRRVLGQKDANASLNVVSPRVHAKPSPDPSALLSPMGRINVTQGRAHVISASPQAGRKRRISEVGGVEAEGVRERVEASQQTQMTDEANSAPEKLARLSTLSPATAAHADHSLSASQCDRELVETQFELPADEMSQSSLEKMHEVPMPPSISSSTGDRPDSRLNAEDSQLSSGMSSFVDFGGSDASQPSDIRRSQSPNSQHDATETLPAEVEEGRRKALMDQKAAELRTRLQFAYFKVQTNQTSTPLSRLKVPEGMRKIVSPTPNQKLTVFAHHIHLPAPTSPGSRQMSASEVSSLESRISAMRARATGQPKARVRSLDSLPTPPIVPHTSTSTGNHHTTAVQPHPNTKEDLDQRSLTNTPNSPPSSRSSADIEDDDTPSSSGRSTSRDPNTPEPRSRPVTQLSSPPLSHGASEDDTHLTPQPDRIALDTTRPHAPGAKGTPSSAIKGEVADSLLQLMRGVSSTQSKS